MLPLHPDTVYPPPQIIRVYWQERLEAIRAAAPENGAVKYALDCCCLIRQQEIRAGLLSRSAWTLYPQSPLSCCLLLTQALQALTTATRLLVDLIVEWHPARATPCLCDALSSLSALALEEVQRLQKLSQALLHELSEIAQENEHQDLLEAVTCKGLHVTRSFCLQREKVSAYIPHAECKERKG